MPVETAALGDVRQRAFLSVLRKAANWCSYT